MTRNRSELVCDICGCKGARVRKMARTYGKGRALLVIENIPVVSCPSCGDSYLEPETVRAIERIKRDRKRLATARTIAVASLD